MTAPEMPTDWRSARWWRNRSPEERQYFTKAPRRYVENETDTVFIQPEEFGLGTNWIVTGRPCTGKTTIAVHNVLDLVGKRPYSGRFVAADEYVEMIKDTFNNEGDLPEMWSSPYLVKYIKGVYDVVILDGIGQERNTEFARHEIGSLIRRRYEMGLSTIITSDMPVTDIIARYGNRVAGALRDYKEVRCGR